MNPDILKALLDKRKALKGRTTRLETIAGSRDTLSKVAVQLYLNKLDKLSDEVDELHNSIAEQCTEDEYNVHELDYNNLVSRIEALTILFTADVSQEQETTNQLGVNRTSAATNANIKLPRLALPTFGGKYEDWLPFHDLFTATVHNNATLSGAQKLHYLKSSLKNEAALMINSIPITDGNYVEAWEILMNRFNNNREIIDAQIARLFDQPCIVQESASALRTLIDTTTECIRALKVLKEPVEHWDAMLLHIVKGKLDQDSRKQWELSLKGTTSPTFKEFMTFMEQRARALSVSTPTNSCNKLKQFQHAIPKTSIVPTTRAKSSSNQYRTTANHHGSLQPNCVMCNGNHPIFTCQRFLKASINERRNIVKTHGMCFNCFKQNHLVSDCKSGHCKKCTAKHNTLLHQDDQQHSTSNKSQEAQETVSSHISRDAGYHKQVILSTAVIHVKDIRGQLHPIRALLDSGSQASFVTENCAQKLQLKRNRSNTTITGIGSTGVGTSRSSIEITVQSQADPSVNISVEALVIPKVTKPLPNLKCDHKTWSHIKGLSLADPNFHTPGNIDILLGADIYSDILEVGCLRGPPGAPGAFNTVFGWVLSGIAGSQPTSSSVLVHQCNIDDQLKQFWEIEELPKQLFLTPDEIQCEKHFSETHSRDDAGRYTVRLPFKNPSFFVGGSRKNAVRRFLQVERRLQSDQSRYQQYKDFMNEYITLGHMELISPQNVHQEISRSYYLPHHSVIKETSTTTKLRVVFDASAKSTNGISLNDGLLVGPKLQIDLFQLLIRFRLPLIAMTADIAKMYRQIWMHPEDSDYQRIVWRTNTNEPVQDFRLLTVTYGTASAPYLATKVLQQLSQDEKASFPLASSVIAEDFYIDDLMTGADTSTEALALQKELIQVMQQGGFELRKWASNDPAVLDSLPDELKEIHTPFKIDNTETIKTLGLHWHPGPDYFSFFVTSPPIRTIITKRTMLSDTAKLFDPLGLLAPTTIRAKLMLQELWQLKLDWDEPLPADLARKWVTFREELPQIENIKSKRCIKQPNTDTISIHGFCDASEKAYAAAVYMQSIATDGQVRVQLIASKTRVAPLKTITLPRLELCGAVLLVNLIKVVQDSFKTQFKDIHAWTDSTVVLAWLASHPQRWKTFVSNRVADIQQILPSLEWHHVSGDQNPADCASRGISASDLQQNTLWWHGPPWLQTKSSIPSQLTSELEPTDCKIEEKKMKAISTHIQVDNSLLYAYSSLSKLKRVTAYIRRFIHNARNPKHLRNVGPISKQELDAALIHWIKMSQAEEFQEEIKRLQITKALSSKSKILSFNPYLDQDQVLRVGGRLANARLSNDQKHPILIPRKSKLAEMLIREEHFKHFHAGSQLLLSVIQQRFWLIGARDAIRYFIKKCTICVRQRAVTMQQIMGNLPSARINPSRPFLKCGVDYTGPFILRVIKGRGHKQYKAYIAVFVCFTTHALHIELVSDMTTEAFLAALRRFIARRGKSSDIYSDCGTNFVGAEREMREFLTFTQGSPHTTQVHQFLAEEGITWHFNPPAAPHFGGLWEAGVKSLKFHLKRVIGSNTFTFEEMQTLLCQIEACLNSRPLTALSQDPDDFNALTPGHFLIGDALTAVPEPDFSSLPSNRLSRWQLGQKVLQHFWKRWRSEYLSRLQQRPKWATKKESLQIGDLVLLKDEDLPPTKWKLGRVLFLHPGPDECVRVVTVKTAEKELKRPIVKLCRLPVD